jgi:hypothetical protein
MPFKIISSPALPTLMATVLKETGASLHIVTSEISLLFIFKTALSSKHWIESVNVFHKVVGEPGGGGGGVPGKKIAKIFSKIITMLEYISFESQN